MGGGGDAAAAVEPLLRPRQGPGVGMGSPLILTMPMHIYVSVRLSTHLPVQSSTHHYSLISQVIYSSSLILIHPFIHSSIHPFIHTYLYTYTYITVRLSTHLSVSHLFTHCQFIHPFALLLIHPLIHPFTHSSIYLSIHPSTHPSIHPHTHPSTHLSAVYGASLTTLFLMLRIHHKTRLGHFSYRSYLLVYIT